jgi:fructoselysine-6-P-deglycase FrlB-like protein
MESEIHSQLQYLQNIPLQKQDKKCLIVGSGDSFAASLAAQYASRNRILCCHPLDLVANPSIADGRVVYLVSISGKTKANVLAARSAGKSGLGTVAVTAKLDSPLVASCDDVIEINYERASVTTAGTISFTTSLLTCLSLAMDIRIPKNLKALFALAEKETSAFVMHRKFVADPYFILGSGVLFPIAIYGALKINEVMGAKALAYPTEEFCHSPIFSMSRKDAIVILGSGGDSPLSRRLEREGYSSILVQNRSNCMLQKLLYSTFFVQLLALKLAQKRNLKECYFLRNKPLLGISSDFIYG